MAVARESDAIGQRINYSYDGDNRELGAVWKNSSGVKSTVATCGKSSARFAPPCTKADWKALRPTRLRDLIGCSSVWTAS